MAAPTGSLLLTSIPFPMGWHHRGATSAPADGKPWALGHRPRYLCQRRCADHLIRMDERTRWMERQAHQSRLLSDPHVQIARAVSVREAWGHQRLEVLPGQEGLAQLVGA